MKIDIIPVIFQSKRPGVFSPMLGVAQEINPDRYIVVKNVRSFLKAIWDFRCAASEYGNRHNNVERPLPLLVVINYGSSYLRWMAVVGFKHLIAQTVSVQIGRRRRSLEAFDVVALPSDVGREGIDERKIMDLPALPAPVNKKILNEASEKWMHLLKHADKKLVAIMIGGNFKTGKFSEWKFTEAHAAELVAQVLEFTQKQDCNLVLTTSRRTSPEVAAYLKKRLAPLCIHAHFYGEGGENPYYGYLALADAIIAPPDSRTMLSEIAATTCPIYVSRPVDMPQGGESRFLDSLIALKRVVELPSALHFEKQKPLNAAETIHKRVREVIAEKMGAVPAQSGVLTASPR